MQADKQDGKQADIETTSKTLIGKLKALLSAGWRIFWKWFFEPLDFRSKAKNSSERAFLASSAVVRYGFVALIIFLVFASLTELDEITRAQGSVTASSRTQIIQSQEGGVIQEILVKEGDLVAQGQLLLRVEDTKFKAAYEDALGRVAALSATAARLRAEIFGGLPSFPEVTKSFPEFRKNQYDLLVKRRSLINEDVQALTEVLGLVQSELKMLLPLLETGDVSRTEVLRLQRQEADIRSQITNRRNKYFQDAQAELGKVEEDLASAEQALNQRRWSLESAELKAPLKGIVKNIRVTTRGGVLRPGEEAMQIVPVDDDLYIEVRIKPKDIAYMRTGLPVTLKIDAYDPAIYGSLPGELVYISADTISENLRAGEEPYFVARVRATSREFSGRPGADLEIQPGMTATAEIKTGSKSVLTYLTKPVSKTLSGSLGER